MLGGTDLFTGSFVNVVTVNGNVTTPTCPVAGNTACVTATDTATVTAKPVIDVTASSHNVTYGDSVPTITCTIDTADFVGGDTAAVLNTLPTGSTVYTASSGVPGPYTTSCSGGSDDKYAFNYIAGGVTVAKKTIDVQASSHNLTYGDSVPTITCTLDATDFENGETGAVINTAPTGSTVYTASSGVPGPYDTECSGGSDNNYDFNYIDGAINVAKKTIDVQASSHNLTYGDSVPTITCTYDATDFENGENGSVIDTAPTGSTVYTASSGVPGPYDTECSGGSDNNYDFNYIDGAINVAKKTIDVQASSHNVTYGDSKPTITCTLDATDFEKIGETAAVINTLPTGSTVYTASSGVPGPYDTECSGGSDNNYDFNYIDGQVDVAKKTIDVQASSHNVTYGDSKPTITCTLDATDFENGETAAVINTLPTGSTVYTATSGVPGPYDTECAGGSDNNYDFNYTDGAINVAKKTIDVQASSHNVTYGDAKPTITCTYDATDFENGENGSVINTAPTGSTVYTATSGVPGPYRHGVFGRFGQQLRLQLHRRCHQRREEDDRRAGVLAQRHVWGLEADDHVHAGRD